MNQLLQSSHHRVGGAPPLLCVPLLMEVLVADNQHGLSQLELLLNPLREATSWAPDVMRSDINVVGLETFDYDLHKHLFFFLRALRRVDEQDREAS